MLLNHNNCKQISEANVNHDKEEDETLLSVVSLSLSLSIDMLELGLSKKDKIMIKSFLPRL